MPLLAIPIVLALIVVVPGCDGGRDTAPEDGAAAHDGGADGGVVSCGAPDTECPVTPPVSGGPCEGALRCDYTEGTFAECVEGAWRSVSCPGCPPPLAEGCRPAFDGTLAGAALRVGPAEGRLRAFADGDRVRPEFGPQGGAMVAFHVAVEHPSPPDCVAVTVDVGLDGVPSAPATFPLRLRCGTSYRVYAILPDTPCELRDYAVTLAVDARGIASSSTDLVLEGGGCPRTL